jgi:tripartite-type tricarboxylate transporter receptor subunit TctC
MMRTKCAIVCLVAGSGLWGANATKGESFPSKPIRMVTAEPGGSNDLAARLIAPGLSEYLGQQVVVDYRGGANGNIAAGLVANANPDGYTLLSYGSTIWISPLLQDKAPYDALRDFAPISLTISSPNILVVNPSLPAKSVKELITLAKTTPGQLNYASGITGSTTHLSAELFKYMAGVDLVRVPYKGSGPALIDLISGQVKVMFPVAAAGLPHVKSGKLRALGVTSPEPSDLVPGMPTVAASGLPGYESTALSGIWSAAKTPKSVVERLNHEVLRVLDRADIKDKFLNAGAVTVGSTPQKFAAVMQSDIARMSKVIKSSGIHAE